MPPLNVIPLLYLMNNKSALIPPASLGLHKILQRCDVMLMGSNGALFTWKERKLQIKDDSFHQGLVALDF